MNHNNPYPTENHYPDWQERLILRATGVVCGIWLAWICEGLVREFL